MNRRRVFALVARDLRLVRRSRALMIPMIGLPLLVLVVLPVLLSSLPLLAGRSPEGRAEFRRMLQDLPTAARTAHTTQSPEQGWIYVVNEQLFPPLFLLVPLVVVTVIAADSFAGERERRTLEALLYTPLSDAELFVGKVLSAWLPALGITALGLIVYSTAVNAAAWPIMQRVFVPTASWLVLAVWMAPAVTLFALAGTILISLRVRGTYEAMQLGGLMVLPVVALIVGQVRGLIRVGPWAVFGMGAAAWLAAAALLFFGVRAFRRTRLITRL